MNVLKIKEAVRARDGYKCQVCKLTNKQHIRATGKALEVHRLEPGSEYTIDGCATLCRRCHSWQPRSKHQRGRRVVLEIDKDDRGPLYLIAYWIAKERGLYRIKAGELIMEWVQEKITELFPVAIKHEMARMEGMRETLAEETSSADMAQESPKDAFPPPPPPAQTS